MHNSINVEEEYSQTSRAGARAAAVSGAFTGRPPEGLVTAGVNGELTEGLRGGMLISNTRYARSQYPVSIRHPPEPDLVPLAGAATGCDEPVGVAGALDD